MNRSSGNWSMVLPSATKWKGASMWVPEWTLMFRAELLLGSPLLMRRRSSNSKGGAVTHRKVSPVSFREIS